MIPIISDFEIKRACNIIWNSADNYEFRPDFKAFRENGEADLYWNCIIGAVRKHYDYSKIEELFRSVAEYEESNTYEELIWLSLEDCTYRKEIHEFPGLKELRRHYAEDFVKKIGVPDDSMLFEALACAHYRKVLGLDPKLNKYSMSLLEGLEMAENAGTDEIVHRIKELFEQWLHVVLHENREKKQKKFFLPGVRKTNHYRNKPGRTKKFGIGFADRPDNAYGGLRVETIEKKPIATKLTAQELWLFMQSKFGQSTLNDKDHKDLEHILCISNHASTHLLITEGKEALVKVENGFEALQREREARQKQQNREYFKVNITRNRIAEESLSNKIRNSVLMYLEPSTYLNNTGKLESTLCWRGQILGQNKIFSLTSSDESGNLSVDILLDASTSQRGREGIISTQANIIKGALTKCNIPCRVTSFCSMTGYTILRILHDYNASVRDEGIFDFVANGCNRDGLAISALRHLMRNNPYGHKIMIIMSDAKPNDVIKIADRTTGELIGYDNAAGIYDTAFEVRKAKAEGISVICVFTGEEADAESAKMIYGKDFAKISSPEMLADTVGKLLTNHIQNI